MLPPSSIAGREADRTEVGRDRRGVTSWLSPQVRRSVSRATWFLVPFAALVAAWYAIVAVTGVPTRMFPQVDAVLSAGARLVASHQLFLDVGASLGRVAIGVGLALATGVPFGILMGSSRIVSDFCTPLLRFSVALSGIAWIPFATLWLGYGPQVCIFIIWNSVFFAVVYNTMLGVRSIDGDLQRAARSLGAGRLRLYTEVLLPGSLPATVMGMRVGLGYGWRGLIAAEMIATSSGLGYGLFLAQKHYQTDDIVLIMIVIGSLWLLMDRFILAPLERRTVQRWGMTRKVL
jgi:NitT/TauT family transport system permease protein/taurine transport system permease protein